MSHRKTIVWPRIEFAKKEQVLGNISKRVFGNPLYNFSATYSTTFRQPTLQLLSRSTKSTQKPKIKPATLMRKNERKKVQKWEKKGKAKKCKNEKKRQSKKVQKWEKKAKQKVQKWEKRQSKKVQKKWSQKKVKTCHSWFAFDLIKIGVCPKTSFLRKVAKKWVRCRSCLRVRRF